MDEDKWKKVKWGIAIGVLCLMLICLTLLIVASSGVFPVSKPTLLIPSVTIPISPPTSVTLFPE